MFGTGIIGALAAYPIAVYIMGKEAALFAYVLPFIISSAGGDILWERGLTDEAVGCYVQAREKTANGIVQLELDKFFGDEQ